MKTIRLWIWTAVLLGAAFGLCACGTTPLGTRSLEEHYLGMGYANMMMQYGQDLLNQGRYPEAMAAFASAERAAYTNDLRQAARDRRMWLEDVLADMEAGQSPEPSPNDVVRSQHELFDSPMPSDFRESRLTN